MQYEAHFPFPCKKDCPNRNADCHSNCKPYLDYEERKFRDYDNRRKLAAAEGFEDFELASYIRKRQKRNGAPVVLKMNKKKWQG